MVLSSEEKRKNNALTCVGKALFYGTGKKEREKEFIKRTKSTPAFADIDLAPCVNPVNTIFVPSKLNTQLYFFVLQFSFHNDCNHIFRSVMI